jgi:predicted DNA repair protein MutK
MPPLLQGLSVVGTAAMLWVGGGIIVHGLEHFHLPPVPGWVEGFSHWAGRAPVVGEATGWLAFAVGSAATGFVIGGVLVAALHFWPRRAGH